MKHLKLINQLRGNAFQHKNLFIMKKKIVLVITTIGMTMFLSNCEPRAPITSDSGVKKVSAKVKTGADGMTVEQRNVRDRLEEDNKVGSIKHLYIISAYSGQIILYSTVRNKVTSGGKRLTSTLKLQRGDRGQAYGDFQMPRIQDDGTYGSSMNYLYWWDTKGIYHQHYVTGGQILHISSEPITTKDIILNLEVRQSVK